VANFLLNSNTSDKILKILAFIALFGLIETIGITLVVRFYFTDLLIITVNGFLLIILGFSFIIKLVKILRVNIIKTERRTISKIKSKSKRNIINLDEVNKIDPTIYAQTISKYRY